MPFMLETGTITTVTDYVLNFLAAVDPVVSEVVVVVVIEGEIPGGLLLEDRSSESSLQVSYIQHDYYLIVSVPNWIALNYFREDLVEICGSFQFFPI